MASRSAGVRPFGMQARHFLTPLLLGVLADAPPAGAAAFVVDTTADAVDAAPGDGTCATAVGACSLRAAIEEANALPGRDMVVLADVAYTLAIAPAAPLDETTGDLDIRDDLDLVGGVAGGTIVDGDRLDRIFLVGAGVVVTIRGVTIQNGFVPPIGEGGGAILNLGDLTLTDSAVLASTTDLGGGIFNAAGATLAVDGSSVRGNRADDAGGGIRNEGTLRLSGSEVFDNVAGRDGGGIANAGALAVSGSTIQGNRAIGRGTLPGDGGGLANEASGVATIAESFLKLNAAGGQGGGILNAGSLSVSGSAIKVNAAVAPGGGIANAGALAVSGSTIQGNRAIGRGTLPGDGGGLANEAGGVATIAESFLKLNAAGGQGGGILNAGSLSVSGSAIKVNAAVAPGGGIANAGLLGLVNTSVSTNSSAAAGGGIATSGTVSLNNVTVVFNTSAGEAGGIAETAGPVTLANTILAANTAPRGAECTGTLTSGGYNLVGNLAGCTLGGDATGNVTGQDPHLAPPAANGGPTPNHALLAGSPAINAGNPAPPGSADGACAPTDQRGVARPQGGRCDIGAYETFCGDGMIEPAPDATGEECDGSACCSPSCASLPTGGGCADDGDVCTEDRCDDAGTCRHVVDRYAGVDCELGRLSEPGVCGDVPLGVNLHRAIARQVRRARALVRKAGGASPKKANRRLRKAIAHLDAIRRRVGRARTTPATCRATLKALVEERRELIASLRPAPREGA